MRGVSQLFGNASRQLAKRSSAEDIVINRSESRLIALERRNLAARSRKKAARVVQPAARSANDENPATTTRKAARVEVRTASAS